MNGHHPSTTSELPMFPALRLMERDTALEPARRGRQPYWRAPVTPPSQDVYIPAWNWHSIHETDGLELITLDANGAYLGAAGGVVIAHSHLSHTGPHDYPMAPREVTPGYYLISVPYWAFSGTIVSPLGDSSRLQTEDTVWVAHPTLILLLELLEDGAIAEVTIHDSWTTAQTADFKKWVARLREIRAELLDSIDRCRTDAARDVALDKYARFKEGYSAALSMMLTGERCKTHRPDWTHAVYAQHAASQWRKGWRWTATGHPLISMGHVDELTVLADDLPEVMSRQGKRPFRYDPTGRSLGAMKPKTTTTDDPRPTAAPLTLTEDFGDIL